MSKDQQSEVQSKWSNAPFSKVLTRLGLDSISGLASAILVSPIMYSIDKAVIEKTDRNLSITKSVTNTVKNMFGNPYRFFTNKKYLWIIAVYGPTYIAANTIDSLCKIYKQNDLFPKLIGVTAVNMLMSILKDRAYAVYFGQKASGKVGWVSLSFWLIRDISTIAGAFIIPAKLSQKLQQKQKMDEDQADNVAQMASPVLFQFVLTPVHLMGYDVYYRKDSTVLQRILGIAKIYPSTLGIRMIRMGGAYGVGGVSNKNLRDFLISKAEGSAWDEGY